MEQVGTQADPVRCDRDVWVWVSQPAAAAFINLDLQGSKRHIITAASLIPSQSRSRCLKGPCLTPNSWRCCDLQLTWRSLCCATLRCCCRLFNEPVKSTRRTEDSPESCNQSDQTHLAPVQSFSSCRLSHQVKS